MLEAGVQFLKIERETFRRNGTPFDRMSNLLKQLGDDWHQSHPYEKLVLSVVPSSPYVKEIEDTLISIYVDSHYGYKAYKSATQSSVYDRDIDIWTAQKKTIDTDMKKEEDILEKLSQKFAELQKFLDPSAQEEEEEEEDEEEEELVAVPKERGKERILSQVNKASVKSKREQEKQMAKQAKITQANMATAQEKLLSLQKEKEELEKKILYYGHYRDASLGFSNSMKRIVQSFERTQDLETLVKEVADLHAYYDMIRRRYVPQDRCKGSAKGLCETHYLPLYTPVLAQQKEGWSVRCALHP